MWHGSVAIKVPSAIQDTADEIFRREGRERACRTVREILKKNLIGDLAQEQGITSCAFAHELTILQLRFLLTFFLSYSETDFFPHG